MKKFFIYKTVPMEQISELIKREPKLASFLDLKHPFTVRIMPDHYQCFIHSVISQQLNSAAVDSIWNRFVLNFKKINPKAVVKANTEQLSAVGLSPQKISLIKKVTYDIIDGKLNLKKLEKMTNDEIRTILTKYKYLGNWTTDMLLMFTYYRNDMLPITDYGIRLGLMKLYGVKEVTEKLAATVKDKMAEYSTIFSFCLWRINQGL
ncbi:MAG: hypothetical protein LBS76_03470 [Mycoplasmataceae bacterium]|nr:hypothetical protein [Mycoplasmataceae bacterium]